MAYIKQLEAYAGTSLANREVYIRGVTWMGNMVAILARNYGFPVAAFIDRERKSAGYSLPVLTQDEFQTKTTGSKPYILIMPSKTNHPYIAAEYEEQGWKPGEDFAWFEDVFTRDDEEYSFEIIGDDGSAMHPADFARILAKAISESPHILDVELFNWNNPLEHPRLAEIVAITWDHHVIPSIQFEMTRDTDLRYLLDSPAVLLRVFIKTSLGKSEKQYFAKSLTVLRDYYASLQRLQLLTVDYSLYRDIDTESYSYIHNLCTKLGVSFTFSHGYFRPLDVIESALSGTRSVESITSRQWLSIPEAMAKAKEQHSRLCGFRNCFVVDPNLDLRQCYNWRGGDLTFGPYLDLSLREMRICRDQSELCRRCRVYSLHRYTSICLSSLLAEEYVPNKSKEKKGVAE